MKKTFFFIFILLLATTFALGALPLASADEAHYAVGEDKVTFYFYNDFGDAYTFDLPSGYTVALGDSRVRDGITYLRATFNGLSGWIKSSDQSKLTLAASKVDLPRAIVTCNLPVIFVPSTAGNVTTVAYEDNSTLVYLGDFTDSKGTVYYAVLKLTDGDSVYYVPVANANQEDVERIIHPKATDTGTDSSTVVSTDTGSTKKGFTWVRLVLIIGIIAPLGVILLFIFRPRRRVSRAYRELTDVEEDEDDLDVE